jgi:tetratricopeptide (TPR) repeat protein
MYKLANLHLAFLMLVLTLSVIVITAQEKDILAEANQLYTSRKYADAEQSYRNLLQQKLDEPTRAKVIFNLGLTYKQLKQYDKAIQTFEQIFAMAVNDREAGGNIMQAYRNYRPSAQWEIGKCLFAKGDYEGAYLAFRTTKEKYPFQTWCGTCRAGYERDYVVYQAISLEYLGRYREAVSLYWQIFDPRLVELYYDTGQIEDLKAMVAKKDEVYISERMQKYAWTREKASEYLPSGALNDFIELYDFEKAGDWASLLKSAPRLAPIKENGKRNTAAEILARHPEQILPLIKKELDSPNSRTPYRLYYEILGRAATDESLSVLKNLAAKEINWWVSAALVRSLSLAGAKGEKILREIEPNASENMKLAIERYRKGELEEETEIVKFPAFKPKIKLPINL